MTFLFSRVVTPGESNNPRALLSMRHQRNKIIYRESEVIDWFTVSQLLRDLFPKFLRLFERRWILLLRSLFWWFLVASSWDVSGF